MQAVDVNNSAIAQLLATFMCQVLHTKYGMSGFEVMSPPHTLQTDSSSCGVLVCWFALQFVQGKSLTDSCNTNAMRVSIYHMIRGTCLRYRSGSRHLELSKCPLCKTLIEVEEGKAECRRCCQCYHSKCLIPDEDDAQKKGSDCNIFYCPPAHT